MTNGSCVPFHANMTKTLTLCVLLCAPVYAATYETDFGDPASAADWDLHRQGAGVARIAGGSLLLDMTAPAAGKHVWAELRYVVKLPFTFAWDEKVEEDSPHFYTAGVAVRDPTGAVAQMGLTGLPLNHVAHFSNRRGRESLHVGVWYHCALTVNATHDATLTVTERNTGRPGARFTGRLSQLKGRLCKLSFYHNQERNRSADAFAQNRGASRFDNVRLTAAGLGRGDMADYRDKDIRGYDVREPMTFNRTMKWLGENEGVAEAMLAYDAAPALFLTGNRQAASWQCNRLCSMKPLDETTSRFTRPNDLDGPDCVAVRSFQWCVRQHPRLVYTLAPRAGACWLKVTLVCPFLGDGIELFRTSPAEATRHGTVDLAGLFRDRGLGFHQFGEIGVFVYQDRPPDPKASTGSCLVSLEFTGDGALLTTPSLVRTEAEARRGVTISALPVDAHAGRLHSGEVTVTGRWRPANGSSAAPGPAHRFSLAERDHTGVYAHVIRGLPAGDSLVSLVAETPQGDRWTNSLRVSVVPADFACWRPGCPTYQTRRGRVLPTLLGDLYAWTPLLDPESPKRRVIASATEWRGLSKEEKARVRLVKLRTLRPEDIDRQLRQHAAEGMGVIRLTPNVSPHESYLDAGGHVSPCGLETLLLVLQTCRRYHLRALINLFHYPYWSAATGRFPPWRQYLDAGYTGTVSFRDPAIETMLRQYLRELLLFLRDDPAVLGYSLTGENDQLYGPAWINDLFRFVTACDPNHLVTQEQGGGIEHCAGGVPWAYDAYKPTRSGGLGYRTYYTGGTKSDAYLMVCGRFYAARHPDFTAEFASGPGWYGAFWRNWIHPDFLTKVRDNCWTALLTQQTMCVSWSAPWTQEERFIPSLCARQIDWQTFHRRRPPVGLRVKPVTRSSLPRLVAYEAALAELGVDYDYVWSKHDASRYAVLLDPDEPFDASQLPPEVLAARPIVASGAYSVNYLWSRSPGQMIAFVKNTGSYKLGPGHGRGVQELHRRRTKVSDLTITIRPQTAGATWKLYDVDDRRLARSGMTGKQVVLSVGATRHDYAVLVVPGSPAPKRP